MEKKLETLEDVAEVAEARPRQTDAERRRFPRKPIHGVLKAQVQLPGSPKFAVQLRDLSRGGIGFSSDRHLQRNEQFTMTAKLQREELQMLCCTRRCYLDKKSNGYVVGAEILEVRRSKQDSAAAFEAPGGDVDAKHVSVVAEKLQSLLNEQL